MDSKLTPRTFGILIFRNIIQIKEIPRKFSSKKFQSMTRTIIVCIMKRYDNFVINPIDLKYSIIERQRARLYKYKHKKIA